MALDFPSLPYDGQIYVDATSGSKYIWEAATSKWKSIQHAGVVIAYGFDKANAAYLTANAAYDTANAALPNVSNAVFNGNLRVTGNLQIGTNTVTIRDNHVISAEYYRMNTDNHMVVVPDGNRVNALFTLANISFDTANSAYASANNVGPQIAPTYNTANAAYNAANASVKLTSSSQTITGDLSITGNLFIGGNTTSISANNLVVDDSLIYLANNNVSDTLDIGFVGSYYNATSVHVHTGLVRDHESKQYYLFQGYAGNPDINNDIVPYSNNMVNATLVADLITSNLILGGVNAITTISTSYNTANIAYSTANAGFAKANAALPNTTNAVFQGNLRVTGTLSIGSNTVTISDTSLSSQTVSANTLAANTANVKQVKSNYYTPRDITSVSNAGYNAFLMIVDGKLYSCHGTQGSWASYQTGRYDQSYQADWGFEGMRQTMFPYETTSKVIQADFCGTYNAYALFDNGNLYTWGYNNYGTCGLGDTSQRVVPVLAATGVTEVYSNGCLTSMSNYTASRLYIKKSDGYIYGAGYNGYGALGLGDSSNRSSFTQISALGTSCKYLWNFGADLGSAYAVMNDNSIYVCGYNGYGTYGNGGTTTSYSFVNVTSYFNPTNQTVTKIFGESGSYPCVGVLLGNGDLYTCGYGGNYQIGNGGASTVYSPYKVLTGVTGAWTIGGGGSAGTWFAAQGTNLYAWGYNSYGQAGVNGTSSIGSPMLTVGGNFGDFMNGESIDQTHTTYATAIIRGADGKLYAAGWSGYGENGTSSVAGSNTGWNRILLPGDFYCTRMGSYSTTGTTRGYLAVGADNRMYAWGYNGQYGVHNNNISQTIPVPMQVFMRLGG